MLNPTVTTMAFASLKSILGSAPQTTEPVLGEKVTDIRIRQFSDEYIAGGVLIEICGL